MFLEQSGRLKSGARVKFMRKALFPLGIADLEKLMGSVEILIGTPLKFAQLTEKFPQKIGNINYFVLDEADKMFELGFQEQIDTILSQIEGNAQTCKLMFSATMQPNIQELVKRVMVDPVRIQIGVRNATAPTVTQKIVYVGREDAKLMTLRQSLKEGFTPPMLIFVQSKHRAKELYHELMYDQVNAEVIHGDKKKQERDEIMQKFRMGDIWVLICTDLMSRGIDFKTVNSVLNFDFPSSLVSYIHRVGRTGRAGREGTATTYFTDADLPYVKTIANLMTKSGHEVPSWLDKLKNNGGANNKQWKQLAEKPIRRKTISTDCERNTNRRHLKAIKKDARRNYNKSVREEGGTVDNGENQQKEQQEDLEYL